MCVKLSAPHGKGDVSQASHAGLVVEGGRQHHSARAASEAPAGKLGPITARGLPTSSAETASSSGPRFFSSDLVIADAFARRNSHRPFNQSQAKSTSQGHLDACARPRLSNKLLPPSLGGGSRHAAPAGSSGAAQCHAIPPAIAADLPPMPTSHTHRRASYIVSVNTHERQT